VIVTEGEITPQLASWILRVMLGDGFSDTFDVIRHSDITDGQVP
jgi:hypothetical protein